jgi:hypothetical protein
MTVQYRYMRGTLLLFVHYLGWFGVGSDGNTGLRFSCSIIIQFLLLSRIIDAGRISTAFAPCLMLCLVIPLCSALSYAWFITIGLDVDVFHFYFTFCLAKSTVRLHSMRFGRSLTSSHRNYGPNVHPSRLIDGIL